MVRPLSFLIAATWLAAAPAQAATHDGKWTAKWTGSNGVAGEALLQLAGDTGTFKRVLVGRFQDPCLSLQAPVRVKAGSDGKLALVADYASILADCRSITLNLQAVDDRKMTGTLNRSLEVVLTRE